MVHVPREIQNALRAKAYEDKMREVLRDSEIHRNERIAQRCMDRLRNSYPEMDELTMRHLAVLQAQQEIAMQNMSPGRMQEAYHQYIDILSQWQENQEEMRRQRECRRIVERMPMPHMPGGDNLASYQAWRTFEELLGAVDKEETKPAETEKLKATKPKEMKRKIVLEDS